MSFLFSLIQTKQNSLSLFIHFLWIGSSAFFSLTKKHLPPPTMSLTPARPGKVSSDSLLTILSVAPCEIVTGLKGTGREAGDLAPTPILPSALGAGRVRGNQGTQKCFRK